MVASERGDSNFVCMYLQTQLTKGLNQKLTKTHPEGARYAQGIYAQEEYLCKNLGVEEAEGVCSKGVYFQELTVHIIVLLK